MMKEMIENVSNYLPLRIEELEWNEPYFKMGGKNWNFNTMSNWRIISNNKLICSYEDIEIPNEIKNIKNLSVVSIEIQSSNLPVDPVFLLSNGYKLEIFSTSFLEPWIFDFSSGLVYVASPS